MGLYIRDTVNKILGMDNPINQNNNDLQNKIDNMYGRESGPIKPQNVNPFINKKTGGLMNPFADYKPVLNYEGTTQKVKDWISEATGLESETTANESNTTLGENVGFNGNLDGSSLGSLDVATQLPKLSTNQISKIISTHFKNSPVIKASDAEGIYNAQKTTGMSALAILGIGALESGWGTSNIAKKTNNIWGYGATNVNPEGNAHRYSQMSDGASQFASEFMKTYYNGYGAKSIYSAGTGNNPKGMGYAYTDGGAIDTSWATQVNDIMGKLYNTAKTAGGFSFNNNSAGSSSKGQALVNAAKQFLGTPYVWGGTSSNGVDCSGLVQLAAKAAGVNVPRTTYDQINVGQSVDKNNLQAGDVVFFAGSGGSASAPGHVGIYIGDGQYIHAPRTGDVVKVSNLSGRSDYVGARRIV